MRSHTYLQQSLSAEDLKKNLMMAEIKPKLVALYLVLEGGVPNCILNYMYWLNNTAGMNHFKINNKSCHKVLRTY
jgi:hypothetical protein